MQPALPHPSPAFLVNIGGAHVLVDAVGERLLVLNEDGASSWHRLRAGNPPRTGPEAEFASALVGLGLLPVVPQEPLAQDDGKQPAILAQAPLQVAANTSDPSPFSSDPIW